MVEGQKPIVTITGISGFIGSRVCLDFLKSEDYHVRGTVRDSKNEAKTAPLRKAFGEYFDKLELVDADLLNTESVTKAIAGSTYVVHTASPFFFPENDEDVIKPAVDGTMAVMQACSASGGVKRCVITSSIAAVFCPAKADAPDQETGCFDETIWSNPDRPEGLGGYPKSKTLAEKAAWDYQKSLPEDQKFEIATVNPVLVMGPTLIPGGFQSARYVESFFDGSQKELWPEGTTFVDVRDVSKMHFEALRRPEAANQRFIAFSERLFEKEVGDLLDAEFGPKGYTIPTKEMEGEREKSTRINNEKARTVLGIDFISAKDAIIAMANTLIDHGVIKRAE